MSEQLNTTIRHGNNLTNQLVYRILQSQNQPKSRIQTKIYPLLKYSADDFKSNIEQLGLRNRLKKYTRKYLLFKEDFVCSERKFRVARNINVEKNISKNVGRRDTQKDSKEDIYQNNYRSIRNNQLTKSNNRSISQGKYEGKATSYLNNNQNYCIISKDRNYRQHAIKTDPTNLSNKQLQYQQTQIPSDKEYIDKINKLKHYKMKKYNKNKFALNIRTIDSSRKNLQHSLINGYSNQISPCKNNCDEIQSTNINIEMLKKLRNSKYLKTKDDQIGCVQIRNNKNKKMEQVSIKSTVSLSRQGESMKKNIKKQQSNTTSKNRLPIHHPKQFKFSLYSRDTQDHPAQDRLYRMIQLLNKIVSSFGVTLTKENQNYNKSLLFNYSRYSPKYKYFVGSGNNRNLIVFIMKKRWWWEQTKSAEEANFVWTQIKNIKTLSSILRQQEKIPSSSIDFITTSISPKISHRKINQSTSYFNPAKTHEINQKLLIPSYDRTRGLPLKISRQPTILHNHYPKNGYLGNKKSLFLCLTEYSRYKQDNHNIEYIPETYLLCSKNIDSYKQFQTNNKNNQNSNSLWVVKPGQNSNRGQGIQITKQISLIKLRFDKLQDNTSLIIQKYIDNILLYNGRKFDFRTYMAAITIGGTTKYLWYAEGYIRTSSYKFNLDEYKDPYVHLTNDAIQSGSNNYGRFEEGNKISYKYFDRYLKSINSPFTIVELHQKMKQIAIQAIKSIYPLVHYSQENNQPQFSFQLFGLDFMVDQNYKLYLIQINTNPCLELSSKSLSKLIPQMLDNLLKISLDPIFQPFTQYPRSASNLIPEDLLKYNKFEVIFDSRIDRDFNFQNKILESINDQTIANKLANINQEDCQNQQYPDDGEMLDLSPNK